MNKQPHPAQSLLSRAHSPSSASKHFTERVKTRPLLLRPSSPPANRSNPDARHRRRLERLRKKEYFLRKQKPRPLSAKEKRATGVHRLSKEKGECKWEVYSGLRKLWAAYAREVLGIKDAGQDGRNDRASGKLLSAQLHGPLLASLDYHGAEIEVVRCPCVGRVSTRGVVVRDTMFTFVVVTRKDEVRILPKKDTVFRVAIPLSDTDMEEKSKKGAELVEAAVEQKSLIFELHGNQFQVRAADRANKKFKWRSLDHV